MPTLAAPLDCAKLEVRQQRIHQLGTAPSSPVEGQMYYNTADHTFYWWNNTAWRSADASAGVGGPPTGSAGGDLAGSSYPNPIIAALVVTDGKVAAANKDGAAGTPSMRTLGTGAAQACAGNDGRLADSRAPTGSAGGDLTGSSYPNPTVAALAITDAKVAAANKDGAVGTYSMRTIGTGAQQAMAGSTTLATIAAPGTDVSLNSKRIINLLDPSSAQDAATKNYVDGLIQGLDSTSSCKAATTANITLSGTQTVDGVALVALDRCLVKDQGAPATNGIYVVAAGAWTRALDNDSWAEVPSVYTWIEQGTVNGDTGWVCTADAGGSLGTTPMTWVQFSSAGTAIAGAGLTKTGNQIDAVGTANRITVAADSIDISTAYVGQATITIVGTIASGTWNGTTISVGSGGTGQITAKAARESGLAAPGYFSSSTHGAGTTISISQVTHGLRSAMGLIVQCQIASTGVVIMPDVTVDSGGNVSITFSVSQSANTILTTIIG